GAQPLVAVMSIWGLLPASAPVGVPLSSPVDALNINHPGRGLTDSTGAGSPDAVATYDQCTPAVAVNGGVLVICGGTPCTSIWKACVSTPLVFVAVTVIIGLNPISPTAGAPVSVSPVRVSHAGRPETATTGAG